MDAARNELILESFIAIVLLSVIALVAASPRFLRLRRSRPMTLLLSGGWLAVITGALLGPSGIGVVDPAAMLRLTPLLMVGLGWIGLMIGLQGQRRIIRELPRDLWLLTLVDFVVCLLAFGALAWFGVGLWLAQSDGGEGPAWRLPAVILLIACAIGWSMETRSLRGGDERVAVRLAHLVRGGGALAAIIAIAFFGVASETITRNDAGAPIIDFVQAASRVGIAALLALLLGLLGRFALRLAGRSRADLLVVLLGLVALLAGIAADLGSSPLFASMLAGVVLANIAGDDILGFGRFVLQAEHVVALMFALLAGVLIDPAIGAWGVLLALAIAGARFVIKPLLLRGFIESGTQKGAAEITAPTESPAGPESQPAKLSSAAATLLSIAPVRQGPLAIALGVGLVLAEPSAFNRKLLTVVLLAGLLSEALPLILSAFRQGREKSEERAEAAEVAAVEESQGDADPNREAPR
ncbi:MAG: cation:proton antiporter [Planctomycetota bacterium]|nr:cation:proton antiporter [Planctomycetota bacterium]